VNPNDTRSGIETYRVGLFADLFALRINRSLRRREGAGSQRYPWRWFLASFRRSWRRRSYWNGYLAEWHYCPVGVMHSRAGRGWTRRAALRRLGAHIVGSNLLPTSSRSSTGGES
jgi:hypothetical protein